MKVPKNVWVFYGGPSSEREVSLRSGKGVGDALARKGFNVELIDVTPGESLAQLVLSKSRPDIVFLALHGRFGEDGTIQGFLESLEIPFIGSGSFSSALCMDKIATKLVMENAGLPCIPGKNFYSQDEVATFVSQPKNKNWIVGHQKFIKASRQGSTIGTYRFIPEEHSDPVAAFKKTCDEALTYDNRLVVEDWIKGRELTVTLFKGKALPIVEIRPKSQFYDFQHKYTKGFTEYLCPAPVDAAVAKDIQACAERAFVVLENKDFCRMDVLLCDDNSFHILEMNTLPGMTETSLVPKAAAASGLSYDDFVEELLLSSIKRQEKK